MSKNFFDLTQVGKNQVETGKRIDRQAGEYMDNYYKNLRESTEAEEARKNEAALSAARLGYATTLERSKARVRNLQESIEYENNAAIIGMTEMISQVVEKALLLDEEEYAALNPDYREDIRDTVAGLLKEGEINDEITNKDTLAIMEFVSKALPGVKEFKTLTEDNLSALIRSKQSADINESLSKFAGDVSKKVATLMEKEQKRVKDIQADQAAAGVQAPAEEVPADMPVDENGNPLDPNAVQQEQPMEQQPAVDENGNPIDPNAVPQDPAMAQDPNAGMLMAQPQPMPKKQIQMLPDGTMNVNIFEGQNRFIRETPRCGLIESLAVNEAANMLSEGKEYNADLCLANAIMYVTITETMNAMGLMNIDDRAYNKVIAHAGGKSLVEGSSSNSYISQIKKSQKAEKEELEAKQKAELKAAKKKVELQETVIASQYVPQLNKSQPTDLAERIRAKRLMESFVDKDDEGEDLGFFQLSEDVLNEGLRSSLSLALLKVLPESVVDHILKKAIKKLEKKKPEHYELAVSEINGILGKSLEEKKDFIRQCIQVADPKKVSDAEKIIKDCASNTEKMDRQAEALLTEANITYGKLATGVGAGVAGAAGLIGIGAAIGASGVGPIGAVPLAIIITLFASILVSGIVALVIEAKTSI